MKDVLMIFGVFLFVALSGVIWLFQYICLQFYRFGPFGIPLAAWHLFATIACAIYVEYRRSKSWENWKYEAKGYDPKVMEEYLKLIGKKKEEDDSKSKS